MRKRARNGHMSEHTARWQPPASQEDSRYQKLPCCHSDLRLSIQSCEKINIYCLSHSVSGVLLWQPELTTTFLCPPFLLGSGANPRSSVVFKCLPLGVMSLCQHYEQIKGPEAKLLQGKFYQRVFSFDYKTIATTIMTNFFFKKHLLSTSLCSKGFRKLISVNPPKKNACSGFSYYSPSLHLLMT